MSSTSFIGIDFGTSKSTMAWYNPSTRQASPIRNFEGMDETPSVVYLGKNNDDVAVGKPALSKLRNGTAEQKSLVVSIKRNLLSAPIIVLDNTRIYRPVDIAAIILRKLKEDAERQQFHEPVIHAVITHPATFGPLQQDKIKQAATLAGFSEVILLPEPIAAALAYSYTASKVGDCILVYDFGGGTFDVAVLARDAEQSFTWATEPKGLETCGGDDLDRELYDYCEDVARRKFNRGISLTGDIDLKFLYECRERKENLTFFEEETFSSYLPSNNGPLQFLHTIHRSTFEQRITKYIEETVSLTQEVLKMAQANHSKVDAIVLIGGSSRVPLVSQLLSSRLSVQLPVQTREWQQRDFAVALGAAYYGARMWLPSRPIIPPPPPPPDMLYRQAVTSTWEPLRRLTQDQVNELHSFAQRLGLSFEAAAGVEREIMGQPGPEILKQQHIADLTAYRVAVENAWLDRTLTPEEMNNLSTLSVKLSLSLKDTTAIECQIMGGETKEAIWGRIIHQRLLGEYHKAVQKVWSGMITQEQVNELDAQMTQLGLSRSEASIIEKQITGETKEVLWERHRHQNALNEYRAIVIQAWEPNKMLTQALVNQLSADMTRLGLSQNEVAAIEREIMGKTKEEFIVPSTPPSGSKLRWRWSPAKVKGKTKEEFIVPSTPPNGSKLRKRWPPSKVSALILVVFFSLITIVFFANRSSSIAGFVTLIPLVLCLIWFFRKPKLPVPNRPTTHQPNKPPTAQQ